MIMRDPVYAKIMHNLDKLEKRSFGSVTVNVPSPNDPEKVVQVRYNSPEIREIILKYKELQAEFDDQIGEILARKGRLQKQLSGIHFNWRARAVMGEVGTIQVMRGIGR